jgi:hypothetical protein
MMATAFAVLAACCACAAQKTSTAAAGAAAPTTVVAAKLQPAISPRVTLRISGGFAGLAQEYSISADGASLQAADQKRDQRVNRALSKAERAQLDALMKSAAKVTSAADGWATGCADCILYELEWKSAAGKPTVERCDSLNLGQSPQAALIIKLNELGQAALQSATGKR